MSNDPLRIHVDKVIELLKGLGLDPVDPRDIKSVYIDAESVTVVRFRRTETGSMVLIGEGEVATETVTIRLDHGR
jgi:hypothetical protein